MQLKQAFRTIPPDDDQPAGAIRIKHDGETYTITLPESDRAWLTAILERCDNTWESLRLILHEAYRRARNSRERGANVDTDQGH